MDYVQIYREAWNATKKPTQPDYDDLVEEYRNLLAQRAAGAMNGQITDGPFGAFEGQVYDLTRPKPAKPKDAEPEPKQSAKKPKTVNKPTEKKPAKKPVKVIKKAAKKGKK